MGWSSWNAYGGHQSGELLRETAEAIVANGLDVLGCFKAALRSAWCAADYLDQGLLDL